MSTIDLGATGAVLSPAQDRFVETAVELESLGYPTIWLTGGPMSSLSQVADVVRATTHARVATGIIAVSRFPAPDVVALYEELERDQPERFIVGLGGAHGADPLSTLNRFLDDVEGHIPRERRLMAALGPRMLELARDRSAGAFPVLITPDYASRAKETLGVKAVLAVEQLVVLETDPVQARAIARGSLGFLGRLPAYQANFRRMGFSEDDIAGLGDRLVDALVVWGDADAIVARVDDLRRAGADHVAISVVSGAASPSLAEWATLAEALRIGGSSPT